MALPAKRAATYADIVALPEHVVGELLNGELIVSPRPAPRHGVAASSVGATLGPPFQFGDGGPGGRWIRTRKRSRCTDSKRGTGFWLRRTEPTIV